ncbi:DEAD/DEAH box helicase family protein [Massilibacteroides sp.]|uniref:DEAD/DEAH box helicase n=1 Tax=Massilibacteroides sp. TaxID=2034766 RepID=UPI002621612B|nr:DEAD/DEAH box helicase family protein [Massilibacteroides sp.]MDD4514828.1 DEAD/DEAH box helicase family protein [Massilibacteroides sp.]
MEKRKEGKNGMNNVVEITYSQTGKSSQTDGLGMREMQAKVYKERHRRFLLVKAPPASGKSRALMFVALDKLIHQGLKRIVVAVPEKSIGRSFQSTSLKPFGFFADWTVTPYFNLCDSSNEKDKIKRFREFFVSETKAQILVCTHATLRFGLEDLENEQLQDALFGIDEFHHTSADVNNGLGENIRRIMNQTNAHILAMTGSYFRGDGVPVLRSEDEVLFYPITYDYYQQLDGYKYLKSLGLGYHFYQGHYLTALGKVLDTTKKTIIHIPSVNARASGAVDKYHQVNQIIDLCGNKIETDYNKGLTSVQSKDGRYLKIANLVEDRGDQRSVVQSYLQRMKSKDDVDIIIALGTAKEGFDWEWCEHCLTIGVRGSLTEVVQIIGRCTRDCKGKEHAQFTNLIAAPDATQDDVTIAVNDMLKAITASLLMEQVMAPSWNFRTKKDQMEDFSNKERTIVVEGLKPLSSVRSSQIVTEQLDDLKATILQSPMIAKALGGDTPPEVINKVIIPKIIQETYPDLSNEENEEIRQRLVLDMVLKGKEEEIRPDGNRLIKLTNTFINIDGLTINMIDRVNPFQRAYEIMSKEVTAPVLKVIQNTIAEKKMPMTIEEAVILFKGPYQLYKQSHNTPPSFDDPDPKIRRLAQAINVLKNYKIRKEMGLEFEPSIKQKGDA